MGSRSQQHASKSAAQSEPSSIQNPVQVSEPDLQYEAAPRSSFQGLSQELGIQAKLDIRQPGDRYEQEADRVADEVCDRLSQPDQTSLQPIQTESLETTAPQSGQTTPLETTLQQAQTGGEALPSPVQTSMEKAFGTDFRGVRIHADAQANRLNQTIGSKAFTSDRHIFFRSGNYHPTQPDGQKLLAHELTHVMQQTGGSQSSVVQCELTDDQKKEHRKKGFAQLIKDIEKENLSREEVASLVEEEINSLQIANRLDMSWEETKSDLGEAKLKTALKNPEFVRAMAPEQQFGADVDQWMKTMFKSSNPEMTGILKRLFLVLRQGLYFGQGGEDLQGFGMPLASALSHGGRINMVIDYDGWEHRHQFWNWLMTGKEKRNTHGGRERKAGVTTPGVALSTGVGGLSRRMGTHGVEYNEFGVPLEVSKTSVTGAKKLEGILVKDEQDSDVIEVALFITRWYENRIKDIKAEKETVSDDAIDQTKAEVDTKFTSSTGGKVGRALLAIPTLGVSEGIRAIHKKRLKSKAVKSAKAGKTFTMDDVYGEVHEAGLEAGRTRNALALLKAEGIAKFDDPLTKTTPIKLKQYSTSSLGLGGYKKGKHFGIDLPVGGEGELDVNDKRIEAKGEHGHLYIYYTSPKASEQKFGSLLIGVEGSAPAFFSGNLKGRSDPYGKSHDTKGTSGEFSPTGGQKWRFLKAKSSDLKAPSEYDGMIMRITDEVMAHAQTEYAALTALEQKPKLKARAEEFMRERLAQGSKVADEVTTKADLFDYDK
jgi:hypothetical protein